MPLRHTPELSQDLPGNNIPEQVADARWRGQWAGLMPLAPAVPAPENKLLKGSPPETPSVVGLSGGDRHLRVDASPFSNVEIFAPLKPESIPIALFFAVIALVIQGESANLLSVGAVDFGIIVDSAVILVEKQVVDAIEASFDNPTTLQSAARNVELPQSASLEIVASGP